MGFTGSQLMSGSLACTLVVLVTYIEATAQDAVDLPLYQQRLSEGTYDTPDKRLSRKLQFGRRAAFKHLKFGKRDDEQTGFEPATSDDSQFNDAEDIDTQPNEINKRYYTDMLDNLYLEDLLQSLNVDRWRKRGKMTFGKRTSVEDEMGEMEKKAAMRLKFGKRGDDGGDDEEEEKRARLKFGKRTL